MVISHSYVKLLAGIQFFLVNFWNNLPKQVLVCLKIRYSKIPWCIYPGCPFETAIFEVSHPWANTRDISEVIGLFPSALYAVVICCTKKWYCMYDMVSYYMILNKSL